MPTIWKRFKPPYWCFLLLLIFLLYTYPVGSGGPCPDTHFQCPSSGYCLPVFALCNDVYDCPGHEDEDDCAEFTCVGYYRCRSSHVCVHPTHLCDGVQHCRQNDDELLCDVTSCPPNCVCHGLAFVCARRFPLRVHPDLRYLHAAGTGLTLSDVTHNVMLVHLGLATNGIKELEDVRLFNLRSLDLSDNLIHDVSNRQLSSWPQLRDLSLAGNPLTDSFFVDSSPPSLVPLHVLDLSRIPISELNTDFFSSFSNLAYLNLSGCGIRYLTRNSSMLFARLRSLDVRGSPLTSFPRDMFRDTSQLQRVMADNYKVCCPENLPPGFDPKNCLAPSDELSSCDSLLRSDVYRVILALFAGLALLGNAGSVVARVFMEKWGRNSGFVVFVVHLSVADFLMGLYLAVVGAADHRYRNSYLWEDEAWRHSVVCRMAGVTCFLSSEVSALIVSLITLDRFLVLHFPFSRLRFRRNSASAACGLVWVVGLLLSTAPLLPWTSQWQFYSQTGICIPLPVTRKEFPGSAYSSAVLIVFNFVLFMLIAVGQAFIYFSVRANALTTSGSLRQSQDVRIAQRLITIAVTDFMCWFPIGLLGLMASRGTAIGGEVAVAMAICVLPLNSAVNPFLYTLNVLLERRSRSKEKRLLQQIIAEHTQKRSGKSGQSV